VGYSKNPQTLGTLVVNAELGVILASGETLPLGKKVAAMLGVLLERHGEIVAKTQLMASVWGDVAVDDSSLWQNVHVLRSVLAQHAPHARIETVKGRGYRLVVQPIDAPIVLAPSVLAQPPQRTPRSAVFNWRIIAAFAAGLAIALAIRHTTSTPSPHRILILVSSSKQLLPLPPLPTLGSE
jgi:DNA-binding winged helix-turn-helix (wHTH) protein